MIKLKYCLLVVLWPIANLIAQSYPSISSLTVGEKVPDIILTDVYNYPVSKIQLSDLKGKLVIFDFWGKYCAPCILALPGLDSLQQTFKDKVQIITVSDFKEQKELVKALARFKQTRNLTLPVLLENELLSQYFAHFLVSHMVWIDGKGIIKAITGADYVTKENIQAILDGKEVNWPVKNDRLDFDYKKSLLDFTGLNASGPNYFYYSTFTAHIEGIAPPSGTETDSARKVSFTSFYNYDILSFCQLALDYRTGATRDQFILHVKDTTRYIKPGSLYTDQWNKKNTYCYYLQLPLNIPIQEIEAFVRQDILRWLNILGIQVKKEKRAQAGKDTEIYIITETR